MGHKRPPVGKVSEKFCRGCDKTKSVAEFRRTDRDGIGTYCVECSSIRAREYRNLPGMKEKIKIRAKLHKSDPETHAKYLRNHRKARYGVDFDALWTEQNGCCALCHEPMLPNGNVLDAVSVDHDRSCCDNDENRRQSCGRCVRGLVHKRCNLILGHARDSVRLLRFAIDYLEVWSTRNRPRRHKLATGRYVVQIREENARLFREQSHDWFKRAA